MTNKKECPYCSGTGSVAFSGVYAKTAELLAKQSESINGAGLAKLAGCSGAAMCNRLRAIESMGLATSVRSGREVLWAAVLRGPLKAAKAKRIFSR